MRKAGFPSLPNELVIQIAIDTDNSSLLSLLMCNTALHTLLTPVLHTRALSSRGPQTAMQWAATRGHVSLVKFLLGRGIHPDAGATPVSPPALQDAVFQGRVDIAELLTSHGADVNRENNTPIYRFASMIHVAAYNGDTDMIKLLAEHGADLESYNLVSMYAGTPLRLAVVHSHVGAVQALLALQVSASGEDSPYSTPLEAAEMVACEDTDTEEWWEEMVEIGKMLVNAGAPVRYTEEGLRERGDRPGEEKKVRFRRTMIETRKQCTLSE